MLKTDKKGFVQLLFIPQVWLVILLLSAAIFLIPKIDFSRTLAISASGAKPQLQSEYTTIWASPTDLNIHITSASGAGENQDWKWFGFIDSNSDELVLHTSRGQRSELVSKHNFYGQEVVMLYDADNGRAGVVSGEDIYYGSGAYNYHVVYLKPDTFDSSLVYVFVDNLITPYKTIRVNNPMYIRFEVGENARLGIQFLGYKNQFSCDLSANERWIETQWIGSVSRDDLINKDGLIPTKFCKETRPFVLRDLQQGETAIFPDPIPAFNRGCVFPNTGDCKTPKPLPDNQFIIVRYATYQVAGLENPTDQSQAYRCIQRDSNYKCLKWQIESVIKPVEVVVQCKVDSDCPLPLTQFQNQECLEYSKGCISNKCVYDNTILEAVKCQNQVVTTIKQIEEIEKRTTIPVTGINVFTFTQNKDKSGGFNIGDLAFTATSPQFTCTSSDNAVSAPNPSPDCWKTTINFGGQSFEVKDSEAVLIHSLIKVQYFASGTWVLNPEYHGAKDITNFRFDNWGNTFIFTIDISNAMQLNVEDSSFVLKDSIKQIKVNLLNKLPSGDVIIKSQQRIKTTNQNLPEVAINKYALSGNNKFLIDMNTQNLGINPISLQSFYIIEADTKTLIPSDKITLFYDIVTELPSVTKAVEVEKEVVKPSFIKELWDALIDWIKNLF